MPAFLTKLIASAGTALALMSGSLSLGSEGYHLVFSEDFNQPQLNRSFWQTTMAFIGRQGARHHNDSYMSYATDEDVLLGDGHLRLRADRREIIGEDPKGIFTYTQGFISTHDRFSFTYGYIE